MILKRSLLIILRGSLGITFAVAQSHSWDTLQDRLLTENPEVKAAELQLNAAEESIRTAGVLPDPRFELTTSVSPLETRNGPVENQLMLGQKFPLWGKLNRQEKIAVLRRDRARENSRRVRLNILQQFEVAVAKYIRINESIRILDRYAKELESFQKIALTQYSTGQGFTQHPILKLQIEQTRVQTKKNLLQGELDAVRETLNRLFAGEIDSTKLSRLTWQAVETMAPDEWLSRALTYNPALRSSVIQTNIALLKRELSQKQNLPDLTAGVTWSRVGSTDLSGGVSAGKDALGVKVGLNLPLWFGRNKARVAAARQMEQSATEQSADVRHRVTEEIRSIIADLRETRETVDLFENRLIPEAEQMLSSAFAGYKTGKISFLDLLDSERMVVNLRLDYEQVLAKQRLEEANLRKAAGQLKDED